MVHLAISHHDPNRSRQHPIVCDASLIKSTYIDEIRSIARSEAIISPSVTTISIQQIRSMLKIRRLMSIQRIVNGVNQHRFTIHKLTSLDLHVKNESIPISIHNLMSANDVSLVNFPCHQAINTKTSYACPHTKPEDNRTTITYNDTQQAIAG